MGLAAALNQPPAFNSSLAISSSVSALHLSCFLPDNLPLLPSAHLYVGVKMTPHHSIVHNCPCASRVIHCLMCLRPRVSSFSPATHFLPILPQDECPAPVVPLARQYSFAPVCPPACGLKITPRHSIMHSYLYASRANHCLMCERPRSFTLLANHKFLADSVCPPARRPQDYTTSQHHAQLPMRKQSYSLPHG